MKGWKLTIGIVLCAVVVGACIRMPLYDREKKLELVLDMNLDLHVDIPDTIAVNIPRTIPRPEVMECCFYDPATNKISFSDFVGSTGGTIEAVTGSFKMLVYALGTEFIKIQNERDLMTIEAFTSDISATKKADLAKFYAPPTKAEPEAPIIWAPDHLMMVLMDVDIPDYAGEDQTITIHATANTIVQTFIFEVRTVTGIENIDRVEAFVTNQARSCFFGRGEINTDPVTIYFPVEIDRKHGCLYTTFNTFGKLPGESKSYLHILLHNFQGEELLVTVDITGQFENPDKHIVIEEPIDVPLPESRSDGIVPMVDPWDEQKIDVGIG